MQEHAAQERLHVPGLGEPGRELLHDIVLGIGRTAHAAPQPRHDVRCTRVAVDRDVDDVVERERAGATEHGLGAAVVPARDEHPGAFGGDRPAGEARARLRPRRLRCTAGRPVPLLVVVDTVAEREQLEQLAGEVLVRCLGGVLATVEPDEHRGIARHGRHEIVEASGSERVEHAVLPVQELGDADLLRARREEVVPKERELLACRELGTDHALHDPTDEGAAIGSQPVARLAPLRRIVRPPRGTVRGGVERGCRDGVGRRVLLREAADELVHRGLVAAGGERIDLVGVQPEPGPAGQMGDVAPGGAIRGSRRRDHAPTRSDLNL